MRHLLRLLCPLYALLGAIAAYDTRPVLPECAKTCGATPFSGCDTTGNNQTCVCINSELQANFETCVIARCTVKDWLTTNNITANACDWPARDRSSLLRIIPMTLFIVTTIAVFLRMTAKAIMSRRQIGYDDCVMVVTWLLLVGTTILDWLLSRSGLGRDQWTVPFDDITFTLKLFFMLITNYTAAVWLTKLSILLLYLRLFPDQRFRLVVKIGVAFCCIACFTFTTMSVLQCSPISFSWTFWDYDHTGRCVNIPALAWTHTCVNITADVAVLLLPLPTIWKMNLPVRKRVGVMAMFGLGLFVTSISIIRATLLRFQAFGANQTWTLFLPALWSSIEICMTMICACMPGMRAFYTQILRGRMSKKEDYNQEHNKVVHSDGSVATDESTRNIFEKFVTDRVTLSERAATLPQEESDI